MEALAALSIVCNVVQLVDFAITLAEKCHQLHERGETRQNEMIVQDAKQISALSKAVDDSLKSTPATSRPTSNDEKQIRECAKRCTETAGELEALLIKISTTKGKRLQALTAALKTTWYKGRIRELQKRLESQRDVLELSLLVELRTRVIDEKVQQAKGFSLLEAKAKAMTLALAHSQTTVTSLAHAMEAEHEKTRSAVITHIDRTNAVSQDALQKGLEKLHVHIAGDYAKKLLKSFAFPEMTTRQEEVDEAHMNTFQWIFVDTGISKAPFDDFVSWLRHGNGCYWFSGKAGSGKSTLMSFVLEAQETKNNLQEWVVDSEIVTPAFFFWNPGTQLQKSSRGLLRALLYQILESDQNLATIVVDSLDHHQQAIFDHDGTPEIVWSEKKLIAILKNLLIQIGNTKKKCCLFIDGIDEFEGDHIALLNLIQGVVRLPHIKACISSRPWRVFQQQFRGCPQLRLQDLTRQDMWTYVNDRLMCEVLTSHSDPDFIKNMEDVVQEIVTKAEGVFLWIRLVTQDLLQALPKDDTLTELRERLHVIPKKLKKLFQHILDKHIDEVHRPKAMEYFRLMESSTGSYRLITLALATWNPLKMANADALPFLPFGPGLDHIKNFKSSLSAKTAGLLEIKKVTRKKGRDGSERRLHYGSDSSSSLDFDDDSDIDFEIILPDREAVSSSSQDIVELSKLSVGFLHRSILEWLQEAKLFEEHELVTLSSKLRSKEALLKASIVSFNWQPQPTSSSGVQTIWEQRRFLDFPQVLGIRKAYKEVIKYAHSVEYYDIVTYTSIMDIFGTILASKSPTEPWLHFYYPCIEYAEPQIRHITAPGPFQCLATGEYLLDYLSIKLANTEETERKDHATYILITYFFGNSRFEPPKTGAQVCAFLQYLIEKGAEVNFPRLPSLKPGFSSWDIQQEVFRTPWTRIVDDLWREDGTDEDAVPKSMVESLLRAFIEAGADVNALCPYRWEFEVEHPDVGWNHCSVSYSLSVFTILRAANQRYKSIRENLCSVLEERGACTKFKLHYLHLLPKGVGLQNCDRTCTCVPFTDGDCELMGGLIEEWIMQEHLANSLPVATGVWIRDNETGILIDTLRPPSKEMIDALREIYDRYSERQDLQIWEMTGHDEVSECAERSSNCYWFKKHVETDATNPTDSEEGDRFILNGW